MTDTTVHGHDVLNYLVAAGGTVNRAALVSWATEAHGPDARYHTCSRNGMSLDELLGFLESRGKLALAGETLQVFPEKMCGHDAHDHPHEH